MAPLCTEKKHFSQLEQCLGLWDRLMMNSAFIILLTHWNTVRLQHLWFWQFVGVFFPLPILKRVYFWGIEGGRNWSNKRKKNRKEGLGYYKVNSIKNASGWMYGPVLLGTVGLGFHQSSTLMFRPWHRRQRGADLIIAIFLRLLWLTAQGRRACKKDWVFIF